MGEGASWPAGGPPLTVERRLLVCGGSIWVDVTDDFTFGYNGSNER